MPQGTMLSFEEMVSMKLAELFGSFGYKKFKMSKFEEYDLYIENKSFLKSENIIAFNDPTGKLLALKPDVTLSIAKNTAEQENEPRKLFYSENVYRVSGNMHEFKEIPQIGLEFIGDVDTYSLCEVITLAKLALCEISNSYVLDISHMGLLIGLLESTGLSYDAREKITDFVGTKNSHEIRRVLCENGVSAGLTEKIATLASLYGSIDKIIPLAEKLVVNETTEAAVNELKEICHCLKQSGQADNVNIDFSVVSDISYYNGITFRGFVENVPGCILSGGRYDNLLKKLGKNAGAVGFAVYMDLLSYLGREQIRYDADILLVYSENDSPEKVAELATSLRAQGNRVFVSSVPCSNIKYKKLLTVGREVEEEV
ncbi:MAG: ATP phosphoribosyltransferase regulatory subunit [Acutalibacteraceae bacterium]|nr:ATP phosphoribosyltransferase regulatory subunit [Acutalibacteraceae bacterium]